ncbi:hypothetical protein AB0395_17250 [Streptosporangium sp. NPDC051023]|uniref:WXG100 family type VII secretion target n=1 Tax=Streptosporangium sp. NPDC051023 TaxID=3155410 RepID=UPI003450D726
MAYESDRWLVITAAATTLAAATCLRRPTAWAIAAAVALLVSNPGDMQKAATEWCNPQENGAVDLAALKSQLEGLLAQVKQEGHWEGEACEAFSAQVKDFNLLLDKCKVYRQGMCDTLDQTAEFYHAGVLFACGVAGAMTIITMIYFACKLSWLSLSAEAWVIVALKKVDDVVKAVVKKKMMAIGGAAALMLLLNSFQQDQRRLFYGFQAAPGEQPDFSQVGLQYDSTGGLIPKVDMSMPKMPQTKGSIIPGII